MKHSVCSTAFLCSLFLIMSPVVSIQAASPVYTDEDEIRFVAGLIELGYADYAEPVLTQLLKRRPELEDKAKSVRAQLLVALRRYDEAEALMQRTGRGDAEGQAMNLSLANIYYAQGRMEDATKIFKVFFEKHLTAPQEGELLRLYRDAAFQYAQILDKQGDPKGAVRALDLLLNTKPEKGMRDYVLSLQSGYAVGAVQRSAGQEQKKYVDVIEKNSKELMWGGPGLYFGQAVTHKAAAQFMLGNGSEAEKLIKENYDLLQQIDTAIRNGQIEVPLKESPLAGARYVLGWINYDKGMPLLKSGNNEKAAHKALGLSLTHFYNVYLRYPDSEWGIKAGQRFDAVKKEVERIIGHELKIKGEVDLSDVAKAKKDEADKHYRDKDYASAAESYLRVVNLFPETAAGIEALGRLMLCYHHLEMPIYIKAVAGYAAEHFAGVEEAAHGLLLLAREYFDPDDRGKLAEYEYFTGLLADHFPKNEYVGMMLYTVGEQYWKRKEYDDALAFYARIVEGYPKDKFYPKAIARVGWRYYLQEDYDKAATEFSRYVQVASPGEDKGQGMLWLADAYRQLGRFDKALAAYAEVQEMLSSILPGAMDAAKRTQVLATALFFEAFCYTQMQEPKESIAEYREKAIALYTKLVKEHPHSDTAPRALSTMGVVLMELGKSEEAAAVFGRLSSEYPDSEAGKDALMEMTRALVELKQCDKAAEKARDMLRDSARQSVQRFVRVGNLMVECGNYEVALQAFLQVKENADERKYMEPALYGLGESYYTLGRYEEAIKVLEDLLLRYPKSALYYRAKFMLGQASNATGAYDDAMLHLKDVFLKATDPTLTTKANTVLAKVYESKGDKVEALACLKRISLLGNARSAEMRPVIEDSTIRSIELAMALGRWQEAIEMCDHYMELFPGGKHEDQVKEWKAESRLKLQQGSGVEDSAQ